MSLFRSEWLLQKTGTRLMPGQVGSGVDFNTSSHVGLYAFRAPPAGGTLDLLRWWTAVRGGTAAPNMRIDVHPWDQALNLPIGSPLQTVFATPGPNDTFFDTPPLSVVATPGQWLCAVVRNVDAAPATNWFRIGAHSQEVGTRLLTGYSRLSSDSGATWSLEAWGHCAVVPRFAGFGWHSAPSTRAFATATAGEIWADGGGRRVAGLDYVFDRAMIMQELLFQRLERVSNPMFHVRAEVWNAAGVLVAVSENTLPTGPGEARGSWMFADVLLPANVRHRVVVAPVDAVTSGGMVRPSAGWIAPHSDEWTVGPIKRGVFSSSLGTPVFSTIGLVSQIVMAVPADAPAGAVRSLNFSGGFTL